ncbi:MAG: hypothetical protein ACI9T8_000005 [Candidatus Saccharimonadales bacterium]|jgi:hypothetical protein
MLDICRVQRVGISDLVPEHLRVISEIGFLEVHHEGYKGSVPQALTEALVADQQDIMKLREGDYYRNAPSDWHTDGGNECTVNIHETKSGISIVLLAVAVDPIMTQAKYADLTFTDIMARAEELTRSGQIVPGLSLGFSRRNSTLLWRQQRSEEEPADIAHAVTQGKKPRHSVISELVLKEWPS